MLYLVSDVSYTHNTEKVLQIYEVIMCLSKEQSIKLDPKDANLEIALHGEPSVATVATLEVILSKIVRLAYSLATDFIRYNHEISDSYFVAQQSFFTKSSHLLPTSMNK